MGWGVELGVGWASLDTVDTNDDEDDPQKSDEDDSATALILGAANLKYFILGSKFKLYGQVGTGTALRLTAGKTNEGSGDFGGLYYGPGLMYGGPALYIYGSANRRHSGSHFWQAGIGFNL